MDEEDIADAEEARKLQTTDSSTADERSQNASVMDILKTTGETMGVRLLGRMGWRAGQGIGPKVRRRARLDEQDDPAGGENQETHLFAPENSEMIAFVRKNDRQGLGFEGEGRLAGASVTQPLSKSKPTITDGNEADSAIGTLPKSMKSKK